MTADTEPLLILGLLCGFILCPVYFLFADGHWIIGCVTGLVAFGLILVELLVLYGWLKAHNFLPRWKEP